MCLLHRLSPAWFQSHAGSIEAYPPGRPHGQGLLGFNPTLVRLRPLSGLLRPRPGDGFNPTLVRLRRRMLSKANDCA